MILFVTFVANVRDDVVPRVDRHALDRLPRDHRVMRMIGSERIMRRRMIFSGANHLPCKILLVYQHAVVVVVVVVVV
jgi:hypothetical protein